MLPRSCLWVVLSVVCGAVMSGCGLVQPAPVPAQHSHSVTSGSQENRGATEPSEEDLTKAHAHYGTGVIHEMNDDPELALREYYDAAMGDPGNETLVLGVSWRLLQANQSEKALELLTRATGQPDASGALYARLGVVYSQLGKSDLAIKADRIAIKKEPRSLAGYQNLYLNLLEVKRVKPALAMLDEAARVPRTAPDFLIGLAELYSNLGLQIPAEKPSAFARALAVLERVERAKVVDPQLRIRLASGLELLGNDDLAADVYRGLLDQLPDDAFLCGTVRAKLAALYLRMHNSKLAAEQFQALVRRNPTDDQAHFWLGSIAFDEKRYDDAADAFTKTLLLKPEFRPGYYELARAQINANREQQALETLEKARATFGSDFDLEYLSAVACTLRKDYTNGLKHYAAAETFALATETNRLTGDLRGRFYFEFGVACERKGDCAQAERCFEECLRLSPDFAEALNYLGFMWADRGEKLDRARALIKKAVKADPKNAAYLDSMGWVLFKLRELKPALDHVLDAIRLSDEPDPVLYDHLGDIYSAMGQQDKALEAWNKALSLEPSDAVRKKIQSVGK